MNLRRIRLALARCVCAWPLLLALGFSLFLLWTLHPLANTNASNAGHDFLLLYAAARALRHDQNPYDPAILLRFALSSGLLLRFVTNEAVRFNQPFVYPPLFAWLVIPLTILSPTRALLAWRVISALGVFVGTYGLTSPWRNQVGILRTRTQRAVFAALVLASPLTVYGLFWGNPVELVYAAMGGWVWLLHRRSKRTDVAAGVLMSVSLLKPQLGLPLAILSAACFLSGEDTRRRYARVVVGLAGATLGLLALDLLVIRSSLLLDWLHSIHALSRLTALQPDMPSLLGLLQPSLQDLPPSTYTQLTLLVVALTIATSAALYWLLRGRITPTALFGLLAALLCFGTPYAHANDDILLIPGGLAVLAVVSEARTRLAGRSSRWWRRAWLPALGRAGEHLIMGMAMVALVALYVGGMSQYMHYQAHQLPEHVAIALAPCALLVVLALGLLPALLTGSSSLPPRDGGPTARETEPIGAASPAP